MTEMNQRAVDALGDTNAPGVISNEGVVGTDGKIVPFNKPTAVPYGVDVPINQMVVVERPTFDEDQVNLIKATVGKDLTDGEFKLFMYLAGQYGLDPIRRQIWAVKYGTAPAQIFTGRDGFLEIGHRSGHFDGMKSWVDYDERAQPIKAHCIVYRDDMSHPFETEVLFKEYTTGKNLWVTKPSVMLIKVAESVCLRKAFSVSGLYAPEEIER